MSRKNISGVRRLEGEDLDYGDRLYKQQYQQKLWLEQQMREKEAQKEAERTESSQWQSFFQQCNTYVREQEESIEQRYARMQQEVKEANLQIMREKQNQHILSVMDQHQAGLADQEYTRNHPFMTEDPGTTQSALAPHRVVPYHFKGMSPEQKRAILDEQQRQVEEKKQRQQAEKEREMEEARTLEAQRQLALQLERETQEKQARVNREYRDYLKTQMLEHKDKYEDPYNVNGQDVLIPY